MFFWGITKIFNQIFNPRYFGTLPNQNLCKLLWLMANWNSLMLKESVQNNQNGCLLLAIKTFVKQLLADDNDYQVIGE